MSLRQRPAPAGLGLYLSDTRKDRPCIGYTYHNVIKQTRMAASATELWHCAGNTTLTGKLVSCISLTGVVGAAYTPKALHAQCSHHVTTTCLFAISDTGKDSPCLLARALMPHILPLAGGVLPERLPVAVIPRGVPLVRGGAMLRAGLPGPTWLLFLDT